MNRWFSLMILLCVCGCTGRVTSEAVDHPQLYNDLPELYNDLSQGNIATAKILYLPYDTNTYARVTPETLSQYNTTVEIAPVKGELRSSLEKTIQHTKVEPTNEGADIRWGAIFYNAEGKEIHSIYINRSYINVVGNRGVIDGRKVVVNTALINWFEAHFMPKK